MHRMVLFLLMGVLMVPVAMGQMRTIDDFEDHQGWNAVAAEGVNIAVSTVPGKRGKCLRIDFDFTKGGGYGGVHKVIPITLPDRYQFSFDVRAEAPANNFEFKLIDSTGDNVWWVNRQRYEFPRTWHRIRVKKRHLAFAWGPQRGGDITDVAAIEFMIAAAEGGKGSVFLDNFTLERLEEEVKDVPPEILSSSIAPGSASAETVLDDDPLTRWQSAKTDENQWLLIDFKGRKELGGLVIDWDKDDYARKFTVELSDDAAEWFEQYRGEGGGGRQYVPLPDAEGRYVRLNFAGSSRQNGYGISGVSVEPPSFSDAPNNVYFRIASDSPRGRYPRYFLNEQAFWTVIGADSDTKEALLNEDGAIELDKLACSVEPFMYVDGKLITWAEVQKSQSLAEGWLPIPSVTWKHESFDFSTKAFAYGEAGTSSLVASYRLRNTSKRPLEGKLFLAIRPFQVLPPWQSLNITGGVSKTLTMKGSNSNVTINGDRSVTLLTPAQGFGASTFDLGDVTKYLENGTVPRSSDVVDPHHRASGAFYFDFRLMPGESSDVVLIAPFHRESKAVRLPGETPVETVARAEKETAEGWKAKIGNVGISLPGSGQRITNSMKSYLAYVLINRDGPAIQPGSRTYERAWIRDGSMTSSALLRMGIVPQVKEYLNWYARFQFESGKIPCVVDTRGGDPVPENDSHGQFIYGIHQYFLFTKDTVFLEALWPKVAKAVEYINVLRAQRMTPRYRTDSLRAYFGLVPESISHEGYSAKPMHSYWDDFFVLRGLKDAVSIANLLGKTQEEEAFKRSRDDFQRDLHASIRMAMKQARIDYIPGCVELGDFDATSTAVGIYPCAEQDRLPREAMVRTFDKYWEHFVGRRDGSLTWNDYTPYEVRLVGLFVHLDQKERAHALLDFFFPHQRPTAWNHWAEVVWKDHRTPRMIGDMPHTWVGSDFISAIRSMIAYEREEENVLVVGAGLKEEWLDSAEGVVVTHLPTYFGLLNYAARSKGSNVEFVLKGDLHPAKLTVVSPRSGSPRRITIDGVSQPDGTNAATVVKLPATVVFEY